MVEVESHLLYRFVFGEGDKDYPAGTRDLSKEPFDVRFVQLMLAHEEIANKISRDVFIIIEMDESFKECRVHVDSLSLMDRDEFPVMIAEFADDCKRKNQVMIMHMIQGQKATVLTAIDLN